jgi:phenylacetate-CoA ligase
VLPVSGRTCSHGHLHHDLNMGFVEVVDSATGLGVAPGEIGSVTITPYFPYRECMPLLRYDTRDMVCRLAEEDLACELAGMPATSAILGKADQLDDAALRDRLTGAGIAAPADLPGRSAHLPARRRLRAELREITFTSEEPR